MPQPASLASDTNTDPSKPEQPRSPHSWRWLSVSFGLIGSALLGILLALLGHFLAARLTILPDSVIQLFTILTGLIAVVCLWLAFRLDIVARTPQRALTQPHTSLPVIDQVQAHRQYNGYLLLVVGIFIGLALGILVQLITH